MTVAQKLPQEHEDHHHDQSDGEHSVNCTSLTEARMVCVRSVMTATLIAGGIAACSWGSAALTRSTVSMTLAPGCLKTISRMPRRPFGQAAELGVLRRRRRRWPMSRMRTGAPFR